MACLLPWRPASGWPQGNPAASCDCRRVATVRPDHSIERLDPGLQPTRAQIAARSRVAARSRTAAWLYWLLFDAAAARSATRLAAEVPPALDDCRDAGERERAGFVPAARELPGQQEASA